MDSSIRRRVAAIGMAVGVPLLVAGASVVGPQSMSVGERISASNATPAVHCVLMRSLVC